MANSECRCLRCGAGEAFVTGKTQAEVDLVDAVDYITVLEQRIAELERAAAEGKRITLVTVRPSGKSWLSSHLKNERARAAA